MPEVWQPNETVLREAWSQHHAGIASSAAPDALRAFLIDTEGINPLEDDRCCLSYVVPCLASRQRALAAKLRAARASFARFERDQRSHDFEKARAAVLSLAAVLE